MAILTGNDIWGPQGAEDLKRQMVAIEESRVNVERATRAGMDMGRQMEELNLAKERLMGLIREYYPNMQIPAVPR